MPNERATQRSAPRRGQAAVELAVMMVVVVPLIFYTLFLQDLLSYRLDQQETVNAPPWDFAIVNYQKDQGKDRSHDIGANNRKTFCDHTSAYNTYSDYNKDCNGSEALEHHKSLTAHACWVAFGHNGQVQCGVDDDVARPDGPGFESVGLFYDHWNRGGLAHCTARLGVFNKFITQAFLQDGLGGGSKVQVTRLKAHKDEGGPSGKGPSKALATSHQVAIEDDPLLPKEQPQEACTGDDQLCLQREFFAVLQDPWAVNTGTATRNRAIEEVEPDVWDTNLTRECTTASCRMLTREQDTIHPVYDRAATYYAARGRGTNGQGPAVRAQRYLDQLVSANVLSVNLREDARGDNLLTPTMGWNDDPQRPASPNCTGTLCGFHSGAVDERQKEWRDQGRNDTINAPGIW